MGWEHFAQVTAHLAGDKDGAKVDFKGLMEQPIELQTGTNFKASKETELQASAKFGSAIEVHNIVSHKLNNNLTAKIHQHFFSNRVGTDKAPVDVGFEFSYKL